MELTIEQLKAAAYDCLAAIEYHQKKLQEINQMIAQKSQEGKDIKVPPTPEPAQEGQEEINESSEQSEPLHPVIITEE